MKRFIIISLLAMTTTVGTLACMGPAIDNYYMFSVYNRLSWSQRASQLCDDNWKAYMGKKEKYFYFDADEVEEFARKKGDLLMVSYVKNLKKYLDCASSIRTDTWDYPTKQELNQRQQTLQAVRLYAQGKVNSRLRSQHALLFMRCNMVLGRHAENITFWRQKASQLKETVYRDMMKNIYAGALLKTGKTDEAIRLLVEMGDTESLYTYYYKKRSHQAIEAEYLRSPNSAALPFLVQDFVNNAQEAVDARDEYAYWPGKLFIRDIQQEESRQMQQLCSRVVSEGKTDNPVLWQSAKAWLAFMAGDKKQARKDIDKAIGMQGTPRMKDNAHALRLYIEAADASISDDALAKELQWLEEKAAEERTFDPDYQNHYTEVLHRLIHLVLVERYDSMGRSEVATALIATEDEQHKQGAFDNLQEARLMKRESYNWNPDYDDVFFRRIDTMSVERLKGYMDYIQAKAPQSALHQWLNARVRHDDAFFTELMGTKYLRLGQWQKAAEWLAKVPLSFINTQNITPYAVQRSYSIEPWLKLQRNKGENTEPGVLKATKNAKLDFAREMEQLEAGYTVLTGAERQQRAYQLAVRYFQASHLGEAWFLTRYSQSCMDTLRTNETDLAGRAIGYLEELRKSDDIRLQEKSLFALAYLPTDRWRESEWDDKAADFVWHIRPQSHQYRALSQLSAFVDAHQQEVSPFVSRCDVLKQFRKQMRH